MNTENPTAGDASTEITLTEHSGSGSDGFAPPRPSCAVWVERGYLHEEDEYGRQVREATRVEKLLGAEIDRLKRDLYRSTVGRNTQIIEIERLRAALAKFTNPSRCPSDCVAIAREALEGKP